MLDFLRLFLHVLAAPLRTQAQLEAEVTLLRHQLNVLRRQAPSKPRLTAVDRLLLVWLWRLFPSLRRAITIVQPDTVLRWHRSGFRLYWRWKSRSRSGRPRVPVEVRSLIRRLSMENPQAIGSFAAIPTPRRIPSRICPDRLNGRHRGAAVSATPRSLEALSSARFSARSPTGQARQRS